MFFLSTNTGGEKRCIDISLGYSSKYKGCREYFLALNAHSCFHSLILDEILLILRTFRQLPCIKIFTSLSHLKSFGQHVFSSIGLQFNPACALTRHLFSWFVNVSPKLSKRTKWKESLSHDLLWEAISSYTSRVINMSKMYSMFKEYYTAFSVIDLH